MNDDGPASPRPPAQSALTGADLEALRGLIEAHCGISGIDAFLLERRLGPRLAELGLCSFADYCRYLGSPGDGPAELDVAIEALTTHETYFFREQYQLDAFSAELLPELAERRRSAGRLTIWSAGCSTGEEPYTIAMLLRESGLFRGWSLEVIGFDISRRVLSQARHGVYGPSSFRTTPPELRARYFTEVTEGGRVGARIAAEIREICSFRQLNLMDRAAIAALGSADLILCRNVLIYMKTSARERLLAALFDGLVPGGYLLLGHSESLLSLGTAFEACHRGRALVYRRPLP